MKPHTSLLLLVLLPLIVACSSSKSDDKSDQADKTDKTEKTEKEAEKEKKKPLPICPQVAILRELDTLRDYGTEKPDPSQLVAVSRMVSIEGDCGYQKNGIDVAFDLNFIAQRGPRLGGNRSSFSFFVAVVDPDQNILNKNAITTEFKFRDDAKKIIDKTEHLHVFIPLPKEKYDTGPKYQVLAGFQLTQDQLDAVRAKENRDEKAPE